jgi:hypothetical protein
MKIEAQDPSSQIRSAQVFVRFSMRIILLALFATFIGANFGRAMLWVSMILCVAGGLLKREWPLGRTLTHWDEAAAYAALYCAASAVGLSALP